jgi:hypothetical protein
MSSVNWAAQREALAKQASQQIGKQLWKRPELDQKGSFIMKLDVEPVEVYQRWDAAAKKYIKEDAPGKGISTKFKIGIDYTDPETKETQDCLLVSKTFWKKALPDIEEFAIANPDATRVEVKVRTIKENDFPSLDYIILQKI